MQGNFNQAYDDCVNRIAQGDSVSDCLSRYPEHADELEPVLLAFAGVGEFVPGNGMPSAVRTRIRSRVLGEWDNSHSAPSSWRWWRNWSLVSRVLAAAFVVVFVLSLSSTGVAFASQDAIPGERLYPVKQIQEGVRLWFAFSAEDKVAIYTDLVRIRADEIRQLGESRSSTNATIAVSRMDDHIRSIDQIVIENPEIRQPDVVEQLSADFSVALEQSIFEQDVVESTLQATIAGAPEDTYPCIQRSLDAIQNGRARVQAALESVGGRLPDGQAPIALGTGICAQ